MLFALAAMPSEAKKPTEPEIDLVTWARQQSEQMPAEIDGIRIFRPNDKDADGKIRVTGFMDLPGVDTSHGFTAAYVAVADRLNPETDEVQTVDYDNRRFVVYREIVDGDGKDAAIYRFTTACQFTDGMMTFSSYDINIEYKEKGLIPRKLNIEKMKPATNERHKQLVEGFSTANSRSLDEVVKYIVGNKDIAVTHWDEIKQGKVVKGMNEAEVKLIGGAPRSVNRSGDRTQWMYSNDFIVIFSGGIVTNVIQ